MTGYMRKWTKWILCLAALTLVAGTVLPAMAADEPKPGDNAAPAAGRAPKGPGARGRPVGR